MPVATNQPISFATKRFRPYPEYRDSGIAWLGKVPAHWEVKRLKYLSSINQDALSEKTDPRFELVYVDIGGVEQYQGIFKKEEHIFESAPSRARRIVKDGDVIVSTVRTYLRAIAPIQNPEPNLICSTGFAVIRPLPALESEFAAYALRATYFVERVVADSVGVSYPAIDASKMSTFSIAIPNHEEQKTIAAFLDSETAKIDALIAKKERLIELFQEKRTALITQSVTKGLDPNVPMKNSGIEWLGQIPAHWEVKRLRHIGAALIGLTYEPSDVVDKDEGVLVLRASNVCDGRIVFEDNVFVKRTIPDRLITKLGDILICARSGSRALIGKSAKIDKAFVGLTFGTFMIVFRSDSNDYLFYAFTSTLFNYQSGAFLTSTINQLTLSNLNGFTVPLPPVPEQEAIAGFLDRETARIDGLIIKIHEAIDRNKEYRTALISAAVTGKIDVQDDGLTAQQRKYKP